MTTRKRTKGKSKKPAPADERPGIPPKLLAALVIAHRDAYPPALVEQALAVFTPAVERTLSHGTKGALVARDGGGKYLETDRARVVRAEIDLHVIETIDTRTGTVPTPARPEPFVRLERLPLKVKTALIRTLRTGLRKVKDPTARRGWRYERREVVTSELPEEPYATSRDAKDERTREQIKRLKADTHAALRAIPTLLIELDDRDLTEEALAQRLDIVARHLRRLRAELRR